MQFINTQIKKAEQILLEVDQTANELSTGGITLAPTETDLEARLAQMKQTLETERADRESREEEFLARIRVLEAQAKHAASLERQVAGLQRELEEAKTQRDTAELLELVETARAEAQAARAALATTVRDTATRMAELERVNMDLAMELRQKPPSTKPDEAQRQEASQHDRDERVTEAESRMAAAMAALTSERARSDRLEGEVGRALAEAAEVRRVLEAERQVHENDAAALRERAAVAQQVSCPSSRKEHAARLTRLVHQQLVLVQAQAAKREQGGDAAQRLQSLTAHLEAKQRQIDSLRSDKSALELRLQEALLAGQKRVEPLAQRAGVRLKPLTSNKELEKMLEAADSFSLQAVTLLRALPLARLWVLCYLVFVHVVVVMMGLRGAGSGGDARALRGVA